MGVGGESAWERAVERDERRWDGGVRLCVRGTGSAKILWRRERRADRESFFVGDE